MNMIPVHETLPAYGAEKGVLLAAYDCHYGNHAVAVANTNAPEFCAYLTALEQTGALYLMMARLPGIKPSFP